MSTINIERGIRPIETLYRGCRFRSRLEARWGVFFETLGVPWHYEPEGFKLLSGAWYLPDFLVDLKDQSLWVEIKPAGIDAPLFEQFMEDIKQPGTVLHEIPTPESVKAQEFDGYELWWSEGWDNCHKFCICVSCGAVGFEYLGHSDRIKCGCNKSGRDDHTSHHPRILKALTAARSARFEAGS
jgi:hypothetical protein